MPVAQAVISLNNASMTMSLLDFLHECQQHKQIKKQWKKKFQENTATNEQLVNQSQADPNRGREMVDFVKSQPLITRVWQEEDDDEA